MSSYRRAAIVAWALIGLLLGHKLAYAATFRDPQVLLHVLQDTGHNWLSLTPVFVALLIALLVVTSARGATGATSVRRRYITIAALQLSAYIAVEVLERLAHGSSLSDVVAGLNSGYGPTLLAFGLAAQLLVAAVGLGERRLLVDGRAIPHAQRLLLTRRDGRRLQARDHRLLRHHRRAAALALHDFLPFRST